MKEKILDDTNPSDETIQRWAYDESLLLMEQDEDLLIPMKNKLLIPLIADPACPKGDYILAVLDSHLRSLYHHELGANLSATREAAELAEQANQSKLKDWAALLRRRINYREKTTPVDKEMALAMGEDLLKGPGRKGDISIVEENDKTWELQFSYGTLYKERLSIEKATGCSKLSK